MKRAAAIGYIVAGMLMGIAIGVRINASMAQMRVEGGWGKCHASPPNEGTWQQRDQPHRVQLSDPCGEVGLRWNLANDTSFGVRYVNLGQFAVQSRANNDPKDSANLRGSVSSNHTRPECARPNPVGEPLREDCDYLWNGSGRLDAILVNAGMQPFNLGGVKIGPEAGVAFYRATWRMVIQPVADPSAWQFQVDQRTGINIAPELGVRADWKMLYAAARWYWIPDGAPITPAYRSPIRQVVVGLSIPL